MSKNFIQAIKNLAPSAEFSVCDGQVQWLNPSVAPVTNEQIAAEVLRLDEQEPLDNCKAQASALLYATDWTTIPDVANPANTPYLMNQADFIAYRNAVRQLAVNPVANPVFPDKPTEQWSQS